MAKATGLNQRFFIGGRDISGDIGALTGAGSPRGVLPVTGIDKSAIERLLAHGDGRLTFLSFFNDAADQAHDALKGLPTADVQVIWAFGPAIGDVACGLVAKQVDYPWSRNADGSFQAEIPTLANGVPLEWGVMLTPGKRTDSSATNGSSQNNSAASSDGLAAYLQVFEFTGTSVTATIQESSDDGGADAITAKAAFAAVSAANQTERITASGAVEQYLRVATSGTFSDAKFAVMVRRGDAQDDEAYT